MRAIGSVERLQPQDIAAGEVAHCERITALPVASPEPTLEVHAPDLVRRLCPRQRRKMRRTTTAQLSPPHRLREPEYATDHQVRRVRNNGDIKWLGGRVFLSEALIGEPVGIVETDEGLHTVYYGPIFLGRLDRDGTFRQGAPRSPKNPEPPSQNV